MSNDHDIEQEILDKGLTAKRVRVEQIDALVNSLEIKTHVFEGTTLTAAAAILPNGFVVAVEHSACISPENFDEAIGRKIATTKARDAARNKLWELEGYRLKHEG